MSQPDVHLDAASVLTRLRARLRRHLTESAQREADLLDEIATLEAYAAQLQEQNAALTAQQTPDTEQTVTL